jgi:hypothetical protein
MSTRAHHSHHSHSRRREEGPTMSTAEAHYSRNLLESKGREEGPTMSTAEAHHSHSRRREEGPTMPRRAPLAQRLKSKGREEARPWRARVRTTRTALEKQRQGRGPTMTHARTNHPHNRRREEVPTMSTGTRAPLAQQAKGKKARP